MVLNRTLGWIRSRGPGQVYQGINQFKDVPKIDAPIDSPEVSVFRSQSNDEQYQSAKQKGLLKEEIEDRKSTRKMREDYALWVYRYLIGYSGLVGAVMFLDGWNIRGFDLEPSIMEYLVGSTAVASIGLVLAVTHGLFGKNAQSD